MCPNGQEPDHLKDPGPRSHVRLGAQLDLFHFAELSPGMAFWHGPGLRVWNALAGYWREQNEAMGYEEVRSPLVWDAELWRQSGHWDKYRQLMYHFHLDDREVGLKPMNCPAHIGLYSLRPRSYRELPVRISEMGHVHRYELSGNVNGLLRARSFVIDDAHLFCREEQLAGEVGACLALAQQVYSLFDLELEVELSLRPEERIGDDELWDRAEEALRVALEGSGLPYQEKPGEGAFYGPKIDLHMRDSLGRMWQLGSVQVDYQMPARFDLRYVGPDGREEEADGNARRPVIVHRAMFGSFERFIAILLEHLDGHLPLWCSPRGIVIIPKGEEELAADLAGELRARGVQASVDDRNESIGKRVYEANAARAAAVLVVGPRERADDIFSLRLAGGEQVSLSRQDLVERLASAQHERRLSI